jgi:hypothetical protein
MVPKKFGARHEGYLMGIIVLNHWNSCNARGWALQVPENCSREKPRGQDTYPSIVYMICQLILGHSIFNLLKQKVVFVLPGVIDHLLLVRSPVPLTESAPST